MWIDEGEDCESVFPLPVLSKASLTIKIHIDHTEQNNAARLLYIVSVDDARFAVGYSYLNLTLLP